MVSFFCLKYGLLNWAMCSFPIINESAVAIYKPVTTLMTSIAYQPKCYLAYSFITERRVRLSPFTTGIFHTLPVSR